MDSIGGYRLVRLLGVGSRADVWLGHGRTTGSAAETVAVKVFRPGADEAAVDVEIEALARTSHRHLVRLEDLATAPDGLPSLVLHRLSAVSLGQLLAAGPLPAGEAVTVLAPLALAVAELHRVGVTHGGIRPAAVLFDGDGAPVLARFGTAGIVGDLPSADEFGLHPAQLAAAPGVAVDLAQLAALCGAVLGDAADALGEWRAYLDSPDPQAWTRGLADRLFGIAEPVPVRFSRPDPGERSPLVPARIGREEVVEAGWEPEIIATMTPATPALQRSTLLQDSLALLHLPDSLLDRMGRLGAALDAGPGAVVRPRVLQALRSVRRPMWIVRGLGASATGGAVALLTGGASDAGPAAERAAPAASAPPDTAWPVSTAPTVPPHVLGEDPVAASLALLSARAECRRLTSILCLDGVDQEGSAAIDADAYAIRIAQEGGIGSAEPDLTGTAPTLVDRLGDSALVSFDRAGTPVASLLLVRTEHGWRIRDLVFADGSTAQDDTRDAEGAVVTPYSSPSTPRKSPPSRRSLTATRNRAASAPSTMR